MNRLTDQESPDLRVAAGDPADALERHARLMSRADHGIEGFAELIEAVRVFQDDLTAAAPPVDLVAEIESTLTRFSERLRAHAVGEDDQVTGRMLHLPGRAQALVPVLHVDVDGPDTLSGRVRFGRQYLGTNGAVHGGAVPLIFDELLGRLADAGGRPHSRTAYLHVDFRSITPIEVDLRFDAWFDREEGRKRFLVGTLRHGETVCADISGLFVQLKPGQP